MKLVSLVLVAGVALASPLPRADAAPDVATLGSARATAAAKAYATALTQWAAGKGALEDVGVWSTRWVAALIDVSPRRAPQAFTDHLARMVDLEASVKQHFQAGVSGPYDVDVAAYYRTEAELWHARGTM